MHARRYQTHPNMKLAINSFTRQVFFPRHFPEFANIFWTAGKFVGFPENWSS